MTGQGAALTETAREAFAHGWALTAGPLTPLVKAACVVAIEHVHQHGLTEHALAEAADLGHLSGTWALVSARREVIYAAKVAAIVKAWRKLVRKADLAGAVRKFRATLDENTPPAPIVEALTPAEQEDRRRRQAEAAVAAALALHLLIYPSDPDWQAFVAALQDGMSVAQAEGVAGAVGIAAAQAGVTGVDFQRAYDDALTRQTTVSGTTVTGADTAAVDILTAATNDLAQALLSGSGDDLTAADMLTAAEDALVGDDEGDGLDNAAGLLGDQTLGRSFMTGAIGWFLAQGVAQVNFVTESGACPVCEAIASQNPWDAGSVPTPQIHPRCRCSLEPATALFGFDWSQYF